MAQASTFTSLGGMQVSKGIIYSTADFPVTSPTIDTIKLSHAPLVWRKSLLQDGSQETNIDGTPKWIKTNKRGVYMIIKRTTATYASGVPNIPVLYLEGEEITIHADNEYTFMNDCVIEYGEKVV